MGSDARFLTLAAGTGKAAAPRGRPGIGRPSAPQP